MNLEAPFPWFGGKRRVAKDVWARFGHVKNYVEPFFGSGAVLLGRPEGIDCLETVNDLDGYVANFWRAIKSAPDEVAYWADNPVNENDLFARHVWLVKQSEDLAARLDGDPDFFDAKIAGWWCWGLCCWIGSGFCSGKGPWWVQDGKRVHLGNSGLGVNRQLVHLGSNGRGVNRKLVHLGNSGRGVNRKLVHLGNSGRLDALAEWFSALSLRLSRTRVCSGDWARVCGPSVTYKSGLTAVLLDPPYADTAKRAGDLYRKDSESVAHAVRQWAIDNGDNPKLRIALCGYEGEHDMPSDWSVQSWSTAGGYSSQNSAGSANRHRERIWYSPACLSPEQSTMFDASKKTGS